MLNLVRSIKLSGITGRAIRELLRDEWLVTNGIGGYASGTICGSVTRRYHGILIAALPVPLGRVIMLNHVSEHLKLPNGAFVQLGGEEPPNTSDPNANLHYLTEFRMENQLPVWRYDYEGIVIEKRLFLIHGQNTVHVTYNLLSKQDNLFLELRPSLHFRRHDHPVSEPLQEQFQLGISGNRYEISAGPPWPRLHLEFSGMDCALSQESDPRREFFYLRESERGYESRGQVWNLGCFEMALRHGKTLCLSASTEGWEKMLSLSHEQAVACETARRKRLILQAAPEAREGVPAQLVLAADQFLITPVGRVQQTVRAQAAGDQTQTVIAGYHWFTDWGRDTMISLEGLTLVTGRHDEAGWILRTFANCIREGLIPNLFPEGTNEGLYHTADATLWFFHALNAYLEATGDRLTLSVVLPQLLQIIRCHQKGTLFGIHADPEDGLLCQGQEGYQLTWMDAKAGDWVVTPRRGKTVEINALWYNALRLLAGWLEGAGDLETAREILEYSQKVKASFNDRFWFEEGGYLFDVVDGEQGHDQAFRPNQILAISMEHPVLEAHYWPMVIEKVTQRLLTPVGLRSLSKEHPDYKPKYFGDLRARDAAYHQGTVWAWLIGPYIDSLLKAFPEKTEEALHLLEKFEPHLNEACIGSISEIFDAESPFKPRGCIAQAWSVAEVLRCWVKVLRLAKNKAREEAVLTY